MLDETNQDLISSGEWTDFAKINAETNKRLKSKLGLPGLVWGKATDEINEAQQTKIALIIPLEGLVGRLREATYPSWNSDDLELFLADGVPNTRAYKLFVLRLNDEVAKGNPNAKEVLKFLNTEWRRETK